MKKLVSLLLCLMLLGSAAMAETVLNGGENRGISFEKADLNDPIEGLSPVTGRLLSQVAADAPATGFAGQALTGRYMPIIVQIDNADGGIGYDSTTGKAPASPVASTTLGTTPVPPFSFLASSVYCAYNFWFLSLFTG